MASNIPSSDRVADTCEACDQGRTCGGSSFSLYLRSVNTICQSFFDYDQQIEKLQKEKNLIIDDVLYAKRVLEKTSYYSLIGGYKDIFKNSSTHKYKDGIRFEDIVELYYFDEALRYLFLKYLIRVENEIKSRISYAFCEKYGANQSEYLNKAKRVHTEIGCFHIKLKIAYQI